MRRFNSIPILLLLTFTLSVTSRAKESYIPCHYRNSDLYKYFVVDTIYSDSTIIHLQNSDTLFFTPVDSLNKVLIITSDTISVKDSTVFPALSSDSLSIPIDTLGVDSLQIDDIGSETFSDSDEKLELRSFVDIIRGDHGSKKYFSWVFDDTYMSYDTVSIDTLYRFTHLVYPQQKAFETYSYTGNLGGPVQYDHFFTRPIFDRFLFMKGFDVYAPPAAKIPQYNVRSPYSRLFYSSGGPTSRMEEVLKVLHTQNLGKHFNFGFSYDFFGTKGEYKHQEARNGTLTFFTNYCKKNIEAQFAVSNRVYKIQENGGVQDPRFIRDTVMELVPIHLETANLKLQELAFSTNLAYTLININKPITVDSVKVDNYVPLISTRLTVDYARNSRLFIDTKPNQEYYQDFYISPSYTRDSVAKNNLDAKLMLEIAQFARIPGMPGLRGWLGYEQFDYFLFTPQDLLYGIENQVRSSTHMGVAAFSDSPFLGYKGAVRFYFDGYKAFDKLVDGDLWISPWKNMNMPRLKGTLRISEVTPEIFLSKFYSNHIKWDNSLYKEKRFLLQGSFEFKKWKTEIGYNLVHIKDYLFFNKEMLPEQANDLTITSAFLQNHFQFKGLNIFNRIVWQGYTNSEVLSLPDLMAFSSIFHEQVLVKNALTAQIGFNVYFRTRFYADAYSPIISQFHNQRIEQVGGYPLVDAFINFKWKRVLIYLKYDHANQGIPNNDYFATYLYPHNPRVFKYGVLWNFYD